MVEHQLSISNSTSNYYSALTTATTTMNNKKGKRPNDDQSNGQKKAKRYPDDGASESPAMYGRQVSYNNHHPSTGKGWVVHRNPDDELGMLMCNVEYHCEDDKSAAYFVFNTPGYPDDTLRLYRPAMIKLCEKLPEAIEKAKERLALLEGEDGVDLLDEPVDIAIINPHKTMQVKLYINSYKSNVTIYLRLFVDSSFFPDYQPQDENDGPANMRNQNGQRGGHVGANMQGNDGNDQSEQGLVQHWVHTKRAARFSIADNVDRLIEFVSKHH